jgi:hypothetical protein
LVRVPELCPSRGLRASRGRRPRHRVRRDRPGVVVPFKVLPVGGVAGALGCRLPVRPCVRHARPVRCSALRPHPRTRLLGRSFPGVRPSSTVWPAGPARRLSTPSTSPGVSGPFSARGGESSRPGRESENLPAVPIRRLRCRSQVFPTSQRLVALIALPPFSDGWRSWDSPFRGSRLPRRPGGSSPPACPRDVAPTEWPCSLPRWEPPPALAPSPGTSRREPFSSSGPSSARESVRVAATG